MSTKRKRGKKPVVGIGAKRKKTPNKKRYHCTVCSKNFCRKWNLTNHLQIHKPKRAKAQCPYCEARFFEKFNFRQHCLAYHPEKNVSRALSSLVWEDVESELCTDLPTCDKCKKSFRRVENYQSHMSRYHSKRRSKNICKTCSISFPCKSSFEKHLQSCNSAKDYEVETVHDVELENTNENMEVQIVDENINSNEMSSIPENSNGSDSLFNEIEIVDKNVRAINEKTDIPVRPNSVEIVPKFKKIRTNKYPSTLEKSFKKEMMKCECLPNSGCGEKCLNRLSLQECIRKDCNCGENCTNTQIQKPTKLQLVVFETIDKGWGVKTLTGIKSGTFIIEYVGEIVSDAANKKTLQKSEYCLYLEAGLIIDAQNMGNISRFLNHSCQPNCEIQKWIVNGLPRMAIFANRDISAEEELSFDYNFHSYNVGQEMKCECKADNCREIVGRKSTGIRIGTNSENPAEHSNQSLVSFRGIEEVYENDDTMDSLDEISEDGEFKGFAPVVQNVRIQISLHNTHNTLQFLFFSLTIGSVNLKTSLNFSFRIMMNRSMNQQLFTTMQHLMNSTIQMK